MKVEDNHEEHVALLVQYINAAHSWRAWQGEEEMNPNQCGGSLNTLSIATDVPAGERGAGPLLFGLLAGKPILYNWNDHTVLAIGEGSSLSSRPNEAIKVFPDRWGCGNLTIGDVKEIRDFMNAVLAVDKSKRTKAKKNVKKRAKR